MKKLFRFVSGVTGLFTAIGLLMKFYDSPIIPWIMDCWPYLNKKCHELFAQFIMPLGVPESYYWYILICIPLGLLFVCYAVYSICVSLFDAMYHIKKGREAGEIWTLNYGGLNFNLVWIPKGRFEMGLSARNTPAKQQVAPRHRVNLTHGYWVLQGPVNQVQWTKLMNKNHSKNKRVDTLPVENITWNEARAFCSRFKTQILDPRGLTGMEVRLLTEAEWEYASRAGYDYENEKVIQKMAWFGGNSGGQTHPVGTAPKRQNNFKLYDTHGNVREFVLDYYSNLSARRAKNPQGPENGAFHVVRGGSFKTPTIHECLSGFRDKIPDGSRCDDVGFRFAIVLKGK
ncbi:MAG: formylglycine-generating enzyme family protein [Thermoguttaceae bacterium]|nr:formylglycine-generating enzyme family protein [Thermoguttaceae bacterium]